jgi:hypothetical protein
MKWLSAVLSDPHLGPDEQALAMSMAMVAKDGRVDPHDLEDWLNLDRGELDGVL